MLAGVGAATPAGSDPPGPAWRRRRWRRSCGRRRVGCRSFGLIWVNIQNVTGLKKVSLCDLCFLSVA